MMLKQIARHVLWSTSRYAGWTILFVGMVSCASPALCQVNCSLDESKQFCTIGDTAADDKFTESFRIPVTIAKSLDPNAAGTEVRLLIEDGKVAAVLDFNSPTPAKVSWMIQNYSWHMKDGKRCAVKWKIQPDLAKAFPPLGMGTPYLREIHAAVPVQYLWVDTNTGRVVGSAGSGIDRVGTGRMQLAVRQESCERIHLISDDGELFALIYSYADYRSGKYYDGESRFLIGRASLIPTLVLPYPANRARDWYENMFDRSMATEALEPTRYRRFGAAVRAAADISECDTTSILRQLELTRRKYPPDGTPRQATVDEVVADELLTGIRAAKPDFLIRRLELIGNTGSPLHVTKLISQLDGPVEVRQQAAKAMKQIAVRNQIAGVPNEMDEVAAWKAWAATIKSTPSKPSPRR